MQGKTIAKTETSKGNVLLYEFTHPNGPGTCSTTTEYAVEGVDGKVYYFPITVGLKAACDKFKELVAAVGDGARL